MSSPKTGTKEKEGHPEKSSKKGHRSAKEPKEKAVKEGAKAPQNISEINNEWISRLNLLNALSNDLMKYLNNDSLADVMFMVGEEKKKIYGHRFIISVRSKSFASKLHEAAKMAKKGRITLELPGVQPKVFLLILKYLYAGVAELEEDNVMDVATAAEDFSIPDLCDVCEKFISTSLNNESKQLEFLEVAYNCGMKIYKEVFAIVARNATKLFQTQEFCTLSPKHMEEIFQSDDLNITEANLFKALMKWANSPRQLELAKKELSAQGQQLERTSSRIDVHSPKVSRSPSSSGSTEAIKNPIQELINRLLPHVRFPLMTPEELAQIVEPTGIVPMSYLFEAFKFHSFNQVPKNVGHKRFFPRKPMQKGEPQAEAAPAPEEKEAPAEAAPEQAAPVEEVKEEPVVEEEPAKEEEPAAEEEAPAKEEEPAAEEEAPKEAEAALYFKKGVQRDVPIAELNGWKEAYCRNFTKSTHSDDLYKVQGSKVLIGARKKKADTLLMCAMGDLEHVFEKNTTSSKAHEHNGVFWYFSTFKNAKAFGFADAEQILLRNLDQIEPENKKRLSWSLSASNPGGRIGDVAPLRDDDATEYEKMIFVAE